LHDLGGKWSDELSEKLSEVEHSSELDPVLLRDDENSS
jgi:hypothetical protein